MINLSFPISMNEIHMWFDLSLRYMMDTKRDETGRSSRTSTFEDTNFLIHREDSRELPSVAFAESKNQVRNR